MFLADVSSSIVNVVSFDAAGNVLGESRFLDAEQNIVQIRNAPDGLVYFVNIFTGEIRRWVPSSANAVTLDAPLLESEETLQNLDEDLIFSTPLASPPVDFDRRDVSQDGFVSPLDALLLINALKRDPAGVMSTSPWYDVNEDGVLSPLDVLWVINHLSRRSQEPTATGIDDSASLLTGSRMSVDPSTVYDGIGIDEEARRRRIAAVDQVFLSPFSLD
jgi:hypothetical protein